jgi:hypothetical protein
LLHGCHASRRLVKVEGSDGKCSDGCDDPDGHAATAISLIIIHCWAVNGSHFGTPCLNQDDAPRSCGRSIRSKRSPALIVPYQMERWHGLGVAPPTNDRGFHHHRSHIMKVPFLHATTRLRSSLSYGLAVVCLASGLAITHAAAAPRLSAPVLAPAVDLADHVEAFESRTDLTLVHSRSYRHQHRNRNRSYGRRYRGNSDFYFGFPGLNLYLGQGNRRYRNRYDDNNFYYRGRRHGAWGYEQDYHY